LSSAKFYIKWPTWHLTVFLSTKTFTYVKFPDDLSEIYIIADTRNKLWKCCFNFRKFQINCMEDWKGAHWTILFWLSLGKFFVWFVISRVVLFSRNFCSQVNNSGILTFENFHDPLYEEHCIFRSATWINFQVVRKNHSVVSAKLVNYWV